MAKEDFGRVCFPIGGLISVGDSDIKNSRLAFGPEAMNAVVAVENRAYAFPWSRQNFSDAVTAFGAFLAANPKPVLD